VTARTFTHLYDTYDDAVHTVQALESAGVPHDSISIVANNADDRYSTTPDTVAEDNATATTTEHESSGAGAGATLGTVAGGAVGLLTGLGLMAIPGVGPVVAAGWLIATITGAGVGAAGGGLLGSLVGAGVPEEHAHTYAEGVRRGGTLVSVRADEARAAEIEAILDGRTPAAVDVAARRADYQQTGWTKFDEQAPALTPTEVEAERTRRVRIS
jgi:hypothetical protein